MTNQCETYTQTDDGGFILFEHTIRSPLRIPEQSDQRFRGKVITDSGGNVITFRSASKRCAGSDPRS